jgi:hypothetical protein
MVHGLQGRVLAGQSSILPSANANRYRSRQPYLLTCEALSSTREDLAFTVFERLFKERGLPANIRSDNGVPFASAHALFNLSGWRSGGSASVLAPNASGPVILSRMVGMSVCI